MSIIKDALFYLSVPKCVSCGERLAKSDLAFCPSCRKEYAEAKTRNCSRCANLLSQCSCANEHLEAHGIKRLIKVYRYRPTDLSLPENRLIFALKHDFRADAVEFLTAELSEAVRHSVEQPENCIFTNVPRRRKAILDEGYDHAAVLARSLAKEFGGVYAPVLRSTTEKAQKTTHGRERLKNATFDYGKSKLDIKGKRVILVDDIVTTGASMGACATLLRGLGAKEVIGAAAAIAFRDENHASIYPNTK